MVELPTDYPSVDRFKGAVMFHGTSEKAAESIEKELVIPRFQGGCESCAFYLGGDWREAMKYAKGKSIEDESTPVVLAFEISKAARVLDLRNRESRPIFDRFSSVSYNHPERDKALVMAGVDGLFDMTQDGLALFNPHSVKLLGRVSSDGQLNKGIERSNGYTREESTETLRDYAARNAMEVFKLGDNSIHGPQHWKRVERNGLYLAEKMGVNPLLVSLFASMHDMSRRCGSSDEDHGQRAASLIACDKRFREELSEDDFDILRAAIFLHSSDGTTHHPYFSLSSDGTTRDPVVGVLFDADRLDYPRIGNQVNPRYLSTKVAKDIAARFSGDQILDGAFIPPAVHQIKSLPAREFVSVEKTSTFSKQKNR